MRLRRPGLSESGRRANEYVNAATARIDGGSQEAARRAVQVIAPAVRLLRLPTLAILVVPIPFEVATFLLALTWEGAARILGVAVALVMAAVSAFFGVRRARILAAADQPAALATELAVAINLSDRVEETRGALTQLAGGGGWRVFSRLQGMWRTASMPGHWIEGVGDLPRARYFVPPRLGTTITGAIAALWLVPISGLVCLFAVIGTVAAAL